MSAIKSSSSKPSAASRPAKNKPSSANAGGARRSSNVAPAPKGKGPALKPTAKPRTKVPTVVDGQFESSRELEDFMKESRGPKSEPKVDFGAWDLSNFPLIVDGQVESRAAGPR